MDDIVKPKSTLNPRQHPASMLPPRPRPRVSIPIAEHAHLDLASASTPKPHIAGPDLRPVVAPPPAPEPKPEASPQAQPPQGPPAESLDAREAEGPEDLFPTPKAPESIMSTAAELSHEDPTSSGKVSQAPTAPRPRKGSALTVFVALIIALSLVAGAGYAYWQNNRSKDTTKTTPTPATTTKKTTTTKAATSSGVQSTSDAIDKTMTGVKDSDGADETDLSNTTLGL